jgi:uncharacterized membrane protein HdeD (DUF308 family)
VSQTFSPAAQFVHRIWSSAVVSGILAVILGVVILVWPGPSILVTSGVFGAYLVISGVAMVVMGFSFPAPAASRFLSVISGVASVVLGVLAFKHFGEGYAVLLLAIWIGVGFIVRGVTALATAIADKQLPGRGWAIFFGIVSVLAGFVVLAYPFDSIVTLAFVAGIWMVVLGVIEVISGLGMRSDAKKVEKVAGVGGQQPHAAAA